MYDEALAVALLDGRLPAWIGVYFREDTKDSVVKDTLEDFWDTPGPGWTRRLGGWGRGGAPDVAARLAASAPDHHVRRIRQLRASRGASGLRIVLLVHRSNGRGAARG